MLTVTFSIWRFAFSTDHTAVDSACTINTHGTSDWTAESRNCRMLIRNKAATVRFYSTYSKSALIPGESSEPRLRHVKNQKLKHILKICFCLLLIFRTITYMSIIFIPSCTCLPSFNSSLQFLSNVLEKMALSVSQPSTQPLGRLMH